MYYDIILLGIVVSIIYAEFTGFTPAGLVVPGYMVIQLKSPERIAATLVVALLTLGICKLLSNIVILYGRRSFAAMVLVSSALHWALGMFSGGIYPGMIGCLVAGIIARDCERQGIWQSLLSMAIVVGIMALILMLLGHPVLKQGGAWV